MRASHTKSQQNCRDLLESPHNSELSNKSSLLLPFIFEAMPLSLLRRTTRELNVRNYLVGGVYNVPSLVKHSPNF